VKALAALRGGIHRAEDVVAGVVLVAMAAIPIAEIGLRRLFGIGIPAAIPIVQHLTLWVGFLGAMLAAREDRLLALATTSFLPEGRSRAIFRAVATAFTTATCALLAHASLDLLLIEREAGTEIGAGIPTWIGMAILPVAFAVIAVRQAWISGKETWWVRIAVAPALYAGWWLAAHHDVLGGRPFLPWLFLIVACTLAGAPIFAALGAAAAILFAIEYVAPSAIPVETYGLSVSPMLPAIPLFTLTGFLLAEGRSSERLLEVFRAWFGWIPGGTAVVTVLVCAFFTAFTGGSGVTILALGGLLLPALLKENYGEKFSLGTLTASGSLGLLFPPALPLILYGVVAEVPIEDLFVGGVLPGFVLVGLMAAWGVRQGVVSRAVRTEFHLRRALRSLWTGKYELLVPAIAVGALFSGWATLVESAAVTALYALIVQTAVHRDISVRRDLLRVLRNCTVLLGGVLIILGVAKGLTNYMVDAFIPAQLLAWVEAHVESRFVFLLALNAFLLVVGCLMDIFSAIVVVVPLIEPMGEAFGIHPVHLGIIFIANLELGYLTPPVGLNLFLASYRFEKPLLLIYRATVPALLILGIGVLLITYVDGFTLGLLRLLGRA